MQMHKAKANMTKWKNSGDLTPFKTFGEPGLVKMQQAAASFLSDMLEGKPPRWLSLLGPSGSGKTYLADLTIQAIQRHGLSPSEVLPEGIYRDGVRRVHFENALEHMLQTGEWGRFLDICGAKCALIDDIGLGVVPLEISKPKLASLAERRLNKWTLITSNLRLREIADQLDKRIASRMIRGGNQYVEVDVIDFNLRRPE